MCKVVIITITIAVTVTITITITITATTTTTTTITRTITITITITITSKGRSWTPSAIITVKVNLGAFALTFIGRISWAPSQMSTGTFGVFFKLTLHHGLGGTSCQREFRVIFIRRESRKFADVDGNLGVFFKLTLYHGLGGTSCLTLLV